MIRCLEGSRGLYQVDYGHMGARCCHCGQAVVGRLYICVQDAVSVVQAMKSNFKYLIPFDATHRRF